MSRSVTSRPGRAGIAALCVLGLAVNAVTLGPALRFTARGVTDFMDLYAGGKLAFTADLYSPPRVIETEARTEGWSSPTRLFMRLPCFALFYWPLAQLPYPAASAVWEILCVAGFLAFVVIWPAKRRWQTALACCWSLPVWMTVAEGQDIGFVLLTIALAAVLRRNRPFGGGMVAALCLAKFHLFLLIPVWICARKQWRFASGLATGCAVLLALSFAAGGRAWPLRYWGLLREPANNPYRDIMPDLHALFGGLPHAGALELAGVAALALAVWMASRRSRPEWGLAAALAGGVLAAPHAYMADCAMLLPALLFVICATRDVGMRALCFFLLTPLPWVLLMAGMGLPARLGLLALVAVLGWQARRCCEVRLPALQPVYGDGTDYASEAPGRVD